MKLKTTARTVVTAWGVAMMAACAMADSPSSADDPWSLPEWTANDQPIRGTFKYSASTSADAVHIWYRINDGEPLAVEATNVTGSARTIEFALPKLAYSTFGFVSVWAENADTGDPITKQRTVAVADWREFDISGQTAVELLYPMKSWGMQIRFTPCCLINAGYLRVERVKINPAESGEGLPKTLASDFLYLAPDPTVVATSGLNAEIEIDPDSVLADSPEDVTVYEWFKGKWIPVLGAELHEETNTIRFRALEGGFFVLASKLGQQS